MADFDAASAEKPYGLYESLEKKIPEERWKMEVYRRCIR